MRSYYVWLMRTLTPLAVSAVVTVAGYLAVPVDSEEAAALVALALAGGWALLCRGLELTGRRLGWRWLERAAGIMLGWARSPEYRPAPATVDSELAARYRVRDGS